MGHMGHITTTPLDHGFQGMLKHGIRHPGWMAASPTLLRVTWVTWVTWITRTPLVDGGNPCLTQGG